MKRQCNNKNISCHVWIHLVRVWKVYLTYVNLIGNLYIKSCNISISCYDSWYIVTFLNDRNQETGKGAASDVFGGVLDYEIKF